MSKLPKAITKTPLWKQKIPAFPLHYKGDGKRTLLMPNFWMKMIKPEKEVPPDTVHFVVHPQMSTQNIRDYLEKIYDVPVLQVRTQMRKGKDIYPLHAAYDTQKRFNPIWRQDEEKYAFVTLKDDKFTWPTYYPELFSSTEYRTKLTEGFKPILEENKSVNAKKPANAKLPKWFR